MEEVGWKPFLPPVSGLLFSVSGLPSPVYYLLPSVSIILRKSGKTLVIYQ